VWDRRPKPPKNTRHGRAVTAGLQMKAIEARAFKITPIKSIANIARRLINRENASGTDKGLSAEL